MKWTVIQIVEGNLSETHQRDSEREATDLAVKLALEQGDKPEGVVRREFAEEGNVWLQDGEVRIYVTQAEDRDHDIVGDIIASTFAEVSHDGSAGVTGTVGVNFERFADGEVRAALFTSGLGSDQRFVVDLPRRFVDALLDNIGEE